MGAEEHIARVAAEYPGIVERRHILAEQLEELRARGLGKLADSFLAIQPGRHLKPLLFEVFIARWLLSIDAAGDLEYEPACYAKPPDFRFRVAGKLFCSEVKMLMQVSNEAVRKTVEREINKRVDGTGKLLRLWLADTVASAHVEPLVAWANQAAERLPLGARDAYSAKGKVLAWVQVCAESHTGGGVGILDTGGTADGRMSPIDMTRLTRQIRDTMKDANRKFKAVESEAFTFIHMMADFSILLAPERELVAQALYGRECEIVTLMSDGSVRSRAGRHADGIWSRGMLSHTDVLLWHRQDADLLGQVAEPPCIFANPARGLKLADVPKPFASMRAYAV